MLSYPLDFFSFCDDRNYKYIKNKKKIHTWCLFWQGQLAKNKITSQVFRICWVNIWGEWTTNLVRMMIDIVFFIERRMFKFYKDISKWIDIRINDNSYFKKRKKNIWEKYSRLKIMSQPTKFINRENSTFDLVIKNFFFMNI